MILVDYGKPPSRAQRVSNVCGSVAVRSGGLLHPNPGRLLQLAVHIQGTAESELHFRVSACLSAWLPVITATDWPGGLGKNNAVFPL